MPVCRSENNSENVTQSNGKSSQDQFAERRITLKTVTQRIGKISQDQFADRRIRG